MKKVLFVIGLIVLLFIVFVVNLIVEELCIEKVSKVMLKVLSIFFD